MSVADDENSSHHLAPPGPTELLAKRAEYDEGKCTREELKKVEDEAIRKEVERQRQVGIKSITDGEFRRHMYVAPFHPLRSTDMLTCTAVYRFWGTLQVVRAKRSAWLNILLTPA